MVIWNSVAFVYVADVTRIRNITPDKVISQHLTIPPVSCITIAQGIIYTTGYSTDFTYNYYGIYRANNNGSYNLIAGARQGFADGNGSTAQFNAPTGIAADAAGNIFIADRGNNRIRKISKKQIIPI